MRTRRWFCTTLILAFLFAVPVSAQAAIVDITATVQSDFNKTAASADNKLREKMNGNFNSLLSLQTQDKDLESKIKAIRSRNKEEEALLRKRIQNIDAVRIGQLQAEVNAAKQKYKPLFDGYTALNKRIAAAKKLKNKQVNAALGVQKELMKAAVALARQEIKVKETALKAAKDRKNKLAKHIRGILAEIKPVEAKIKGEKSAVNTAKKSVTAEWKQFKRHIKNKDSGSAAASLATIVSTAKKIVTHKQNIYHLELKISDMIGKAKAKMPT